MFFFFQVSFYIDVLDKRENTKNVEENQLVVYESLIGAESGINEYELQNKSKYSVFKKDLHFGSSGTWRQVYITRFFRRFWVFVKYYLFRTF